MKPYVHHLESEVFDMVTGTAQINHILAKVLQDLWWWADNVLPPNVLKKEEMARALSLPALFGFQCYIALQILGKSYCGAILFINFFHEKNTLQT